MTVFSVTCKECRTILKSPKPIPAGAVLTCPKCGVMFAAPSAKPAPEPDYEVVEDDDVIEDVEVVDDSPKKKGPPARPEGKARVDEDRGVRPRRTKAKPKKSNMGLIYGLLGGVVGLVVIGGIALLVWKFLNTGPESPVDYVAGDAPIVGGADLDALNKTTMASYIDIAVNSVLTSYKRAMDAEPKDLFGKLAFSLRGNQTDGQALVAIAGKKAYDKEKFATAFTATAKTVGGKSAYQAEGGLPTIFYPSGKMSVFALGSPQKLDDAVSSSGRKPSGAIADLIKKSESSHIWAVFNPADPSFRELMASAPNVPPGAMKDIDKVKGVALWINFKGGNVEVTVYMPTTDAAAATASAAEANNFMAPFKGIVGGAAILLNPMIPGPAKPLAKELLDTATASADGAAVKVVATIQMATFETAAKAAFDASPLKPPPPGGRPGGR